jgi:glutamate racemase
MKMQFRNYKYYADFDILPLGDKSKVQILRQLKTVSTKLFKDSNLLVLACNTASVNTIRELQQNWLPKNFPSKQILSISKPITELLETQYSRFKDKKLIILATKATVNSEFYQRELEKIGFENVVGIDCHGLCDLIEELAYDLPLQKHSQLLAQSLIQKIFNNIEKPIQSHKITKYIQDLKLSTNSTILLACPHYPIIKNLIQDVDQSCTIIDPSHFIATKLIEYQIKHKEY